MCICLYNGTKVAVKNVAWKKTRFLRFFPRNVCRKFDIFTVTICGIKRTFSHDTLNPVFCAIATQTRVTTHRGKVSLPDLFPPPCVMPLHSHPLPKLQGGLADVDALDIGILDGSKKRANMLLPNI